MSRSVIVDDNDSGITYSGTWFKDDSGALSSMGNWGPPMLGTLHGTNSNSSFTFTFSGTEFMVIYTNQFNNPSGINITCLIDNESVPATLASSPTNNFILCSKDGLTDAEHTFILMVVLTNDETFWFDYLAFVPSASVPLNKAPLSIGQEDVQLQSGMSTGWKSFSPGFVATQTGAQFTFLFTGVSLTYYGFYDPALPWDTSSKTATYSVDGGPPVFFNTQTDVASNASKPTTVRYNQFIFQTDDLPNTNHTLQVTYEGTNSSTPLTLEFLLVNPNPRNVAGSTTPITASSPLSSSAPQATNSTHPSPTPKNNSHLGAIVGAAIGGVAVLILLMLLFIFLRRRQRQGYQRPTSALAPEMAEPFYPMSNQNRSYTYPSVDTSSNTINTDTPLVVPFPAPDPFADGIHSSARVSHLQTPPSAQPYGMPAVELTPKGRIIRDSPLDSRKGRAPMRVATTVVQDEDSGVRLAQSSGQGPVEILPPSYSEN